MKNSSRHSIERRDFLRSSSVATASLLGGGYWSELAAEESRGANQKLQIACVGTANRAAGNIRAVSGEAITAICDVDSNYLERAAGRFPSARRYTDFRQLLDREAPRLDAVVVSTPDHLHAPVTLQAIRKGLHVYCEKPLAHTVQEARWVAAAAKKHQVATQLGTQIHARENFHRVVELLRSGAIGDVSAVHAWVGKGWGGGERPARGEKPPASLDWDLWLGPAPRRPYLAGRYHPAEWRRWWDFGQGTLGDMGCHYLDLPFWALRLRHPVHIEAEGPQPHPETCPEGLVVRYQFPSRGAMPPVAVHWYDGNRVPATLFGYDLPNSGLLFVGDRGMMFANYDRYRLLPDEQFGGYEPPAPSLPRSIGHHAEWLKACKDGSATACDFDYSGALTEAVLLGNVAYRAQSPLEWDAANLRAIDCPVAARYISKPYRRGWELL
jgi:predicted dehydrogenase